MSEPVKIGAVADFPPGCKRVVVVGNDAVAIWNLNGELIAFEDTCPHVGASLSDGWCEADVVTCPLHAWSFNIRTGDGVSAPRGVRLACWDVKIQDEAVFLSARS